MPAWIVGLLQRTGRCRSVMLMAVLAGAGVWPGCQQDPIRADDFRFDSAGGNTDTGGTDVATEDPDLGAPDTGAPDAAPDGVADAPPDPADVPEPDAGLDRVLRHGDQGTVTVVTDGDTVHVTVDDWYYRVRIQGINAPECHKSGIDSQDGFQYVCSSDDEYWGLAAGEAFTARALDAEVTVLCDREVGQPCPLDVYDRSLAFLEDDEGDLGGWMARNGHALSYTAFSSSRRAIYCEAEDLATAEEIGMWALGDRDAVLAMMSSNTRRWYADRDNRCERATQ